METWEAPSLKHFSWPCQTPRCSTRSALETNLHLTENLGADKETYSMDLFSWAPPDTPMLLTVGPRSALLLVKKTLRNSWGEKTWHSHILTGKKNHISVVVTLLTSIYRSSCRLNFLSLPFSPRSCPSTKYIQTEQTLFYQPASCLLLLAHRLLEFSANFLT